MSVDRREWLAAHRLDHDVLTVECRHEWEDIRFAFSGERAYLCTRCGKELWITRRCAMCGDLYEVYQLHLHRFPDPRVDAWRAATT